MDEILRELREEILGEMQAHPEPMDLLGTPAHQLKLKIDQMIEALRRDPNLNPFDVTNEVLGELNRFQRLKM